MIAKVTRLTLSAGLAISVATGAAQANPCAPQDHAIPAALGDAFDAFLAGEYSAFLDLAAPFAQRTPELFEAQFSGLIQVAPRGFERCTLVLHRYEAPGTHQAIALFHSPAFTAPLAVYLVAADIDGETVPLAFVYDSSYTAVLDHLR